MIINKKDISMALTNAFHIWVHKPLYVESHDYRKLIRLRIDVWDWNFFD